MVRILQGNLTIENISADVSSDGITITDERIQEAISSASGNLYTKVDLSTQYRCLKCRLMNSQSSRDILQAIRNKNKVDIIANYTNSSQGIIEAFVGGSIQGKLPDLTDTNEAYEEFEIRFPII